MSSTVVLMGLMVGWVLVVAVPLAVLGFAVPRLLEVPVFMFALKSSLVSLSVAVTLAALVVLLEWMGGRLEW